VDHPVFEPRDARYNSGVLALASSILHKQKAPTLPTRVLHDEVSSEENENMEVFTHNGTFSKPLHSLIHSLSAVN
jgi:hypothetical protein